jgi:hypothetical protein
MVNTPVPEDFTRRENRTIYEVVAQAASEADKVTVDADGIRRVARESLDSALVPHFDRVYAKGEPELFRFALPYELEARLKRVRQHNDRMWLQQCQFMMQEAQETGDKETLAKLLPLLGRSLQPEAEHGIQG